MVRPGQQLAPSHIGKALVNEIDQEPTFDPRAVLSDNGENAESVDEAIWDVVFTRLSGLQEYGYHAGISNVQFFKRSL